MKYTKEQLQGMSDFEVNAELAYLTHKNARSIYRKVPNKSPVSIYVELPSGDVVCSEIKDYCNNWNDVMPLAEQYDISLNPCNKWAHVYMPNGQIVEVCENSPQRAIACCLILVLQEKRK